MITDGGAIAANNPAIWQAAAKAVLSDLPLSLRGIASIDLEALLVDNDRLAEAVEHANTSLIEALVPLVRREVDSGRLVLGVDDDYVSLSTMLASMIMSQVLTIDLTR